LFRRTSTACSESGAPDARTRIVDIGYNGLVADPVAAWKLYMLPRLGTAQTRERKARRTDAAQSQGQAAFRLSAETMGWTVIVSRPGSRFTAAPFDIPKEEGYRMNAEWQQFCETLQRSATSCLSPPDDQPAPKASAYLARLASSGVERYLTGAERLTNGIAFNQPRIGGLTRTTALAPPFESGRRYRITGGIHQAYRIGLGVYSLARPTAAFPGRL